MDTYIGAAADAFVFTGEAGRAIWRGSFNKLVKWSDAIGAAGLHFHDLRHTGNSSPRGHRARACATSWRGWDTTAHVPR